MTSRYLDPKIDLAFKRVFGEHENLLRSLLNALLPLPDDAPIESLEYLTPEQVPELPGLFKNSIVDVKCRDIKGRHFIVEMQMLWSSSFEQRIVFEASQAYVKQLKSGDNYNKLKPVYALALTNSIFDRTSDDYYHHYKTVNVKNPKRVIEGLEFVFIEIPKFKPKTVLEAKTLKRMHVKWLRFMSEVDENYDQKLGDDSRDDDEIQMALKLLETGGYSKEELEIYHIQQDKLRIESTVIDDAKAEGLAKGKAEGLVKGKAEGLEEGKSQMIKMLYANGMSAEQISQAAKMDIIEVRAYLGL
jgi:predicted transposase/invertase (TIGR01784 family)